MNLGKEIKSAMETGKLYFGLKQAKKSLKLNIAKLYIVASDCPDPNFLKDRIENIPIYKYNGKSSELGSLCGAVYSISIITVADPGSSSLLSLKEG
jgi:large subunit ribosomal protein L30e